MLEFLEFFSPHYLLHDAFMNTLVLGFFLPLLSTQLLLRRLFFLSATLPQVSSMGIAGIFFLYSITFGFHLHNSISEEFLALLGATTCSVLALIFLAKKSSEVSTAIVFSISSAMSMLFLSLDPHGEAQMTALLRGDLLSTHAHGWLESLAIFCVGLGIQTIFSKQLSLIALDKDFALVSGVAVKRLELLFFLISGVLIGVSVLHAGPLFTVGYLLFPALAAQKIAKNLKQMIFLLPLIGAVSSSVGFWTAIQLDSPLAPAQVVVAGLGFLLACLVKRIKYQ